MVQYVVREQSDFLRWQREARPVSEEGRLGTFYGEIHAVGAGVELSAMLVEAEVSLDTGLLLADLDFLGDPRERLHHLPRVPHQAAVPDLVFGRPGQVCPPLCPG